MKPLKRTILIIGSAFLLSSCGVQLVQSPEGAGWELGQIGAETWLRMNPNQGWPSSDSAAKYCASVVQDLAEEKGWGLDEILEATNGCADGFVETLDKK
jgi:hypothetical protein